jgi:CRP-like cAMP-binding protein
MQTSIIQAYTALDGLSSNQLREFKGWLTRMEFPEGCLIVTEGQPTKGMYLLNSGKVRIGKKTEFGLARLAELEAPSAFGELGLLTQQPASASVTALSIVVAGFFPATRFNGLVGMGNRTALKIAMNLGRLAATRLLSTNEQLVRTTEAYLKAKNQASADAVSDHLGKFKRYQA